MGISLQHLLIDPASPIIDFYPTEFEIHIRVGDKDWQGIVLLPFIDEDRLRLALHASSSETTLSCTPSYAFRVRQDATAIVGESVGDDSALLDVDQWDFQAR